MPKHLEYEAVIVSLTRLQNSANGNPRWRIHFEDGQTATTQADAQLGYTIDNHRYPARVKIKATPTGRVWDVQPIE